MSPSRRGQHFFHPCRISLGEPVMPGGPGPRDPCRKRTQRAAAVAGVYRVQCRHYLGGPGRVARGEQHPGLQPLRHQVVGC
jgi:hypothetical protein